MFRLLALLQLTRAALAFTAIADAWAVLLLRTPGQPEEPMGRMIVKMLIVSVVSAGLYGFGMTLNDLLDARRDRIFAKWRPIPSGRIGARTAIVVALLLLLLALFAAASLGVLHVAGILWDNNARELIEHPGHLIPWSLVFTFLAAILIVFYDATSKYLGGIGILTLAAIRSFHCLIGNPRTPVLFLSMFLLTHVFLISLIAYKLENKRPHLRRWDLTIGIAGLLLGNALAVWYMDQRGVFSQTYEFPIWVMLIGPLAGMLVFILWTLWLLTRPKLSPRQKGERLMLMGLFWLFVYDASILFSNGQVLAGISVVLLFICALVSFFAIRALNRMMNQPRVQYRIERAPTPS